MNKTLSDSELACGMAFLWDGEGTISCRVFPCRGRRKWYLRMAPSVTVAGTKPEFMRSIYHDLTERKGWHWRWNAETRSHQPTFSPLYVIRAGGRDSIIAFLEWIRPFIRLKRPQLDLILEFYSKSKKYGPYTLRQKEIGDEIRELNRRCGGTYKPVAEVMAEVAERNRLMATPSQAGAGTRKRGRAPEGVETKG